MASESIAVMVNTGLRASPRTAYRTSWRKVSSMRCSRIGFAKRGPPSYGASHARVSDHPDGGWEMAVGKTPISHPPSPINSRESGRRRTAFRGLFERKRELNQLWLAARAGCEAHPVGRGLRLKSSRKYVGPSARRDWQERVRHRDCRVARPRPDVGARNAREEQGVELIRLDCGVDAVCGGEKDVLPAIGVILRTIRLQVHLVGDVQVRLAVLDRAGPLVGDVPLPQLGQRLHGRLVA